MRFATLDAAGITRHLRAWLRPHPGVLYKSGSMPWKMYLDAQHFHEAALDLCVALDCPPGPAPPTTAAASRPRRRPTPTPAAAATACPAAHPVVSESSPPAPPCCPPSYASLEVTSAAP